MHHRLNKISMNQNYLFDVWIIIITYDNMIIIIDKIGVSLL